MPGQYNRQDHYYLEAKGKGFRSRAAYKLLEIEKRRRLIKQGYKVLDLGAWPGGWIQVAASKVGSTGIVIGVDLVGLEPFAEPNVHLIVGDASARTVIAQALGIAGQKFDVVMSDMSPKLSGVKEADRAALIACADAAVMACRESLRIGGAVIIKVFKSNETETFVKSVRPLFNRLDRIELEATRKTSREFYLVGCEFRGDY